MKLTPRQRETVLAALGMWRADLHENPEDHISEYDIWEDGPPLTEEEIDALCEALNADDDGPDRQ